MRSPSSKSKDWMRSNPSTINTVWEKETTLPEHLISKPTQLIRGVCFFYTIIIFALIIFLICSRYTSSLDKFQPDNNVFRIILFWFSPLLLNLFIGISLLSHTTVNSLFTFSFLNLLVSAIALLRLFGLFLVMYLLPSISVGPDGSSDDGGNEKPDYTTNEQVLFLTGMIVATPFFVLSVWIFFICSDARYSIRASYYEQSRNTDMYEQEDKLESTRIPIFWSHSFASSDMISDSSNRNISERVHSGFSDDNLYQSSDSITDYLLMKRKDQERYSFEVNANPSEKSYPHSDSESEINKRPIETNSRVRRSQSFEERQS